MSVVSRMFKNAVDFTTEAFHKIAPIADTLLSGDLITKATYGFDESAVKLNKKTGKLYDSEGVLVTDYALRGKMQEGLLEASTLGGILGAGIGAVSMLVAPPLGAGIIAMSLALPFAGVAAVGYTHAAGSAIRYGLTNFFNTETKVVEAGAVEEKARADVPVKVSGMKL